MLLLHAMIRSRAGIATRRRRRPGRKADNYECHFAVTGRRSLTTYIINGRTGSVRSLQAVDQLQDDWEPFQIITPKPSEIAAADRKLVKKRGQ